MDRELLEKKAGKRITLFFKNGFRSTGKIIAYYLTSFEIEDELQGVKGFLYEDVSEVKEVGE